MRKVLIILSLVLLCAPVTGSTTKDSPGDDYWWPVQQPPGSIVICPVDTKNIPEHMLAESISGLAAQAVNDGKSDEMVWLKRTDPKPRWEMSGGYDAYDAMLKALHLTVKGEFDTWALVKRYAERGIIKGYVLFDEDHSKNVAYPAIRADMNVSSNVATVIASLVKGVLIERSFEAKAQSLGLKKLADATTMSPEECFEKYKDQLNNKMVLAVDPKVGENRDEAIAHKSMVIYGVGPFEEKVMEWVAPLAPVLGWNCGGEFNHTSLATRWGHFNTATFYILNLPLLSAGSWNVPLEKLPAVDPASIHYDEGKYISFVTSDGDNTDWLNCGFFSKDYWDNKSRVSIPMSWTACPSNLSMVNPYAWNHLVETAQGVSVMEYGGGYNYPDLFARDRPNAEELQREFARRINEHMKKTGVTVFGFICKDRKSPEAMRAYKIFAEEIENLTGMMAVPYSTYEDDKGEVIWVKNKKGVDIPVVCPKYVVWAGWKLNNSGNPDKIAALINADASQPGFMATSSMVHVWSYFTRDENGNVHDAKAGDEGAVRGVTPIAWGVEKLDKDIRVVPYEELLWRIRHEHENN